MCRFPDKRADEIAKCLSRKETLSSRKSARGLPIDAQASAARSCCPRVPEDALGVPAAELVQVG